MTKQTVYYDDGSIVELSSKPIQSLRLPAGYFLAQIGEYQVCSSGMPAVIALNDHSDTAFNDQWQLALYAWNFGMLKNNVAELMQGGRWGFNSTGIGDPREPRRCIITNENMSSTIFPKNDKFRVFSLNCLAVKEYDSDHYQLWTMDGNHNPIMKEGKLPPSSIADIDSGKVKSTDYLYNPQETPFAFLVPNNFKNHTGGLTSISPFDGGLRCSWTPAPSEIFTFFPCVSKFTILTEKRMWTKIDDYKSPYRRL